MDLACRPRHLTDNFPPNPRPTDNAIMTWLLLSRKNSFWRLTQDVVETIQPRSFIGPPPLDIRVSYALTMI